VIAAVEELDVLENVSGPCDFNQGRNQNGAGTVADTRSLLSERGSAQAN
jgi:hypothetical protein